MKSLFFRVCIVFFGLCFCVLSMAMEAVPVPSSTPHLAHMSWTFSGLVNNENGDSYAYFFRMQQQGSSYSVVTALFDGQSQERLLFEEATVTLKEPAADHWVVGKAFMRFNPINDSWVFGIKSDEDARYFNFKVDMFNSSTETKAAQSLRPGVDLMVQQSGDINGHVQLGKDMKEQFVTAKNAWFQQITSSSDAKQQPLKGLLCRFDNGSGFYSVNLFESDALCGAIAGWHDEHGALAAMSQFIKVDQTPNGPWHIRMTSPSLHLVLQNLLHQNDIVAGFVAHNKKTGFCVLSNATV